MNKFALLYEDNEHCGVYVIDQSLPPTLISLYDTLGEKSSCTPSEKRKYAIIWHTHSNNSKFYPYTKYKCIMWYKY
jgi:hypothetical protein